MFLQELEERRSLCPGAWLLIGDFNMILHASEKNNNNLDRANMNRFREFVSGLELKDVYMHGRLFTWSNERRTPTMSRLDRALVSIDWELTYPDALLQTLSSSVSDHAPIHLSMAAGLRPKQRFKFELFWLKLEGFEDAVKEGWTCEDSITDPFLRLDACFRNLAVYLRSWGTRKVGNLKLQIAMANILIHRFDEAQEHRALSDGEWWLRRSLKQLVLGLSSLERTMARQRSRMRWLKEGDTNSRLFHAVANGRRVRNFVPAIRVNGELVSDETRKEEAFFRAYSDLLGSIQTRGETLNLQELGMQEHELTDLADIFSEEEVWGVVKELPADRAPGPDGFVGAFYHRAWPLIKREIMAAVFKLFLGDGRNFGRLNRAIITLIPKTHPAEEVGDFRPISLVHSFAKLFTKILSNRLRPKMESLVSVNQSAFIKGRNLHDNFVLVRQMARRINGRRESGVLLKLDISRAFDSLSWAFLFEVLSALGFPAIFLQWLAICFRAASTRVAVNGVLGRRIMHARGLRQGDPLSPQLFVLGMEVVTLLVQKASAQGLLSPIGRATPVQRLSIYADDVVLFAKPEVYDLVAVRELLHIFATATGLRVNYRKTSATLIWGGEAEKVLVAGILQCPIVEFPIRYLGIQLAIKPLTKNQWQPMIEAATSIAPAWQRGMIARPGRLALVKYVMCARPVHHLLVADASCWLLQDLEKSLRGFFWAGKERAHGGQCLVSWDRICKPFEFGGLGIRDLRLQGIALRTRWEWLRRTDVSRPWQGLPPLKDAKAKAVFDTLVRIKAGYGVRTLFWSDRWINGKPAADWPPGLVRLVDARVKHSRSVAQGTVQNKWLLDIPGTLAYRGVRECLSLWLAIRGVTRNLEEPDSFTWPWARSNAYTASSTYGMLVQGRIRFRLVEPIWRCAAAPKCKLFAWLAVQHRIWTSDRRVRHGLQEQTCPCFVCLQEEDTAEHILIQCVFAREIWFRVGGKLGANITPLATDTLEDWWMAVRARCRSSERRLLDSLICTGCHLIWKNRNAWCFNNTTRQFSVPRLAELIVEEFTLLHAIRRREEGVTTDIARE